LIKKALKALAEKLGLKAYKRLSKQDLIYKILDHQAINGKEVEAEVEEKKPAAKTPRAPRAPRAKKEAPAKKTTTKKEAEAPKEG